MPAVLAHGVLKAKDGLDLFYCKDIPNAPHAIVVIVHGLAEHCGRYDHVTAAFNKEGFGVYRFDNRGHGKSGGERGYVEDYNEYLDDAHLVVEQAKADYPNLPVFLLGHSMGGFIGAGYAAKYPGNVTGQIFSGAAVIPLPAFAFLNDTDYRTVSKERFPNALSTLISRDPSVVSDYENDPLVLKDITMQLAGTVLQDGVAWVQENVGNICVPCLILHGGNDQIVPKESGQWLHDNINVVDKTIKIYPELYHEIMNELEKEQVLTDIIDWLHAHR